MQRTDEAEKFIENFASTPLIWENVFRSPKYNKGTQKEVVDLLLTLKDKGIFISIKCQQDPLLRSGEKLSRWVHRSVKSALSQTKGAIRTSRARDYWCDHPRRGKVSFAAGQIMPVEAILIIESVEKVQLDSTVALDAASVPVSYFSVNDFLNILSELRTINDLLRYLELRRRLSLGLQKTIGAEEVIFKHYLLNGGNFRYNYEMDAILQELEDEQDKLISIKKRKEQIDLDAQPVERVLDALSVRMENYAENLDSDVASWFDPAFNRSGYLRMQDELCDLVLDERRKVGVSISLVIEKVTSENKQGIAHQVIRLDSKPDFLYYIVSTGNMSRNDSIKGAAQAACGALAYYEKKNCLIINYDQDRDGYDVALIEDYVSTDQDLEYGKCLFSHLSLSQYLVNNL